MNSLSDPLSERPLVHDRVYPYIEASFPECPPWLNEGLGSLFEACGGQGGKIMGNVNWRLRGLEAVLDTKDMAALPREREAWAMRLTD